MICKTQHQKNPEKLKKLQWFLKGSFGLYPDTKMQSCYDFQWYFLANYDNREEQAKLRECIEQNTQTIAKLADKIDEILR